MVEWPRHSGQGITILHHHAVQSGGHATLTCWNLHVLLHVHVHDIVYMYMHVHVQYTVVQTCVAKVHVLACSCTNTYPPYRPVYLLAENSTIRDEVSSPPPKNNHSVVVAENSSFRYPWAYSAMLFTCVDHLLQCHMTHTCTVDCCHQLHWTE